MLSLCTQIWIFLMALVLLCLIVQAGSLNPQGLSNLSTKRKFPTLSASIPSSGIIDSQSIPNDLLEDHLSSSKLMHYNPTNVNSILTKWKLFLLPWIDSSDAVIIKARIEGEMPLDSAPSSSFLHSMLDETSTLRLRSLTEVTKLLLYAAKDPRVKGIFLEVGTLNCGLPKLQDIRRLIQVYTQSNKFLVGYSTSLTETEFYLSRFCNEFFVHPEGSIALHGFSSSAQFWKGILEKIGVTPQVQRIGKYKSYGDAFDRKNMSDAHREVLSSLLTQKSHFWLQSIALSKNTTMEEVQGIWNETGYKPLQEYVKDGWISGILYEDQIETYLKKKYEQKVSIMSLKMSIVTLFLYALQGWIIYQTMMRDVITWKSLPDKLNVQDKIRTLLQTNMIGKLYLIIQVREVFHWIGNGIKKMWHKCCKLWKLDTKTQFEESYPVRNFDLCKEFQQYPRRSISYTQNNTVDKVSLASVAACVTAPDDSIPTKGYQYPTFLPVQSYLRQVQSIASFLRLPHREVSSGPRIGIINLEGAIPTTDEAIDRWMSLLREAREDESIKAVVLRVDCPGGSALVSDLLWREIRLLSREKPVVASMVNVAASGGYYLSMACDQIVAEEMTLTGSIGVVAMLLKLEKLAKKLGLTVETLSIGRYSEFMNAFRAFSNEEEKYFAQLATQSYLSFLQKAAFSRSMTIEQMHKIAQGRVWTGRQALANGLVDHIGGLWTALDVAIALLPRNDQEIFQHAYRVETIRPVYSLAVKLRQFMKSTALRFFLKSSAVSNKHHRSLLQYKAPEEILTVPEEKNMITQGIETVLDLL